MALKIGLSTKITKEQVLRADVDSIIEDINALKKKLEDLKSGI